MIVKVQISITSPQMALIYDKRHKVQGQFLANKLPQYVLKACEKGYGKAYFHGQMVGSEIDLGLQADEQDW